MAWFCNSQLAEYRRIFRASEEVRRARRSPLTRQAGQIDNLSRRFAWFRRLLRRYEDEQAAAFPREWFVARCLVATFLCATKSVIGSSRADLSRDDLSDVLGRSSSSISVGLLLESLQATLDFEQELATSVGVMVRGRAGASADI